MCEVCQRDPVDPESFDAWIQWAVAQFPVLRGAPPPNEHSLGHWRTLVLEWASAQSDTTNEVVLFLVQFTHASRDLGPHRREGYNLARALVNLDAGNRAGLHRIIDNPRLY